MQVGNPCIGELLCCLYFAEDVDVSLAESLADLFEVCLEVGDVVGGCVAQVGDGFDEHHGDVVHGAYEGYCGSLHLFQFSAIGVDILLLNGEQVEGRACGYLTHRHTQLFGQPVAALPYGIVAQSLRVPRIVAGHAAVMKHGSVGNIYLTHFGPFALPTSAGAAADDEVGLEPLYRYGGGECRCLAAYEVAVVLATVGDNIN